MSEILSLWVTRRKIVIVKMKKFIYKPLTQLITQKFSINMYS